MDMSKQTTIAVLTVGGIALIALALVFWTGEPKGAAPSSTTSTPTGSSSHTNMPTSRDRNDPKAPHQDPLPSSSGTSAATAGHAPSSRPSHPHDDTAPPPIKDSATVANQAPSSPAEESQPDAGPTGVDGGGGKPSGTIPRETVQEGIQTMKPAVKTCYEAMLKTFPEAEGVVKLQFNIVASDGVGHVDLESVMDTSTLVEQDLNDCLIEELRKVEFPAPEGGEVKVTYPFRFS
ncbi:MAG: AgmX/PglI C-terminal domain-containing protein, partial [Myxococcota bacterium]